MAYRELGVIELREVWRRYSAGDGVRAIARGTGVDRNTNAKYVAVGLSRGAPPPTEDQLAAFVRGLRGTPVGRPAALPERLTPYQAQIAAWLTDGLRLTKIHRRLREQGVGVPYSSLHRFAQAHCGFGAPSVTVRIAEPPPGEAAEVHFGRLGVWPDPATGSRRHVYGLLVTLAFSRYAFLWVAASDPIDQSHLVGVHLFGQEELAVMSKLLLAGVARDRGEEMSHARIPLWPEDPPKPLRLLLARTERSRDWIRPTERTVWTSACDRRWRCRASIHACMVQFGSPFLHGHLP